MTLKLFVADDSPTIQKMVSLAFVGEDVDIVSTSTGETALGSVKELKPDIVLLDVFLPGVSGYELCAHIKEDAALQHIPVVLLVSAREPFDESEAARAQCDGHVTKPFDTSELIQLVQTLTGKDLSSQQDADAEGNADGSDAEDQTSPAVASKLGQSSTRSILGPRVQESFLGPNRVLDLFDTKTQAAADAYMERRASSEAAGEASAAFSVGQTAAGFEYPLSDEVLNSIADRVVRHLSPDIIREVAWEVVPDLSEIIIRRILEEQKKT